MKEIDYRNKLTIVHKVAGGGKTTLLLDCVNKTRVDWRYAQQEVWAITYSTKLAKELKDKIRGRTRSGTVHSLALRLVKKHYQALGFAEEPTVLKDVEDRKLFVELANQYKVFWGADQKESKGTADKLAERLHRQHYGRCVDLKTAAGSLGGDSPAAVELNKEFVEEKKRQAVLSYQDMIRLANRLFEIYPEAGKAIDLPKVLLVDEYQDLNPNEQHFVKSLIQHADTSVVVGDDRQMIYGFKGAQLGALRTLGDDFPGCQYLTEDVSYRLTQQTADLVNACYNRQGYPKIQTQKTGEKPVLYWGCSREYTYWAVAHDIRKLLDKGVPLDEIAVLSRFRKSAKQLSLFLVQYGIPVGRGTLRDEEITILKNFQAFAQAVLDIKNESLCRYLQDYCDLTEEQAGVIAGSPETDIPRQDLGLEGHKGDKPKKTLKCVMDCREILLFDKRKYQFRLKKVIRRFISELQGKVDLPRNYSILHILDRYDLNPVGSTLEDIVENIKDFLADPDREGIIIDTIHGNKGRQWKHVFITDIIDQSIFENPRIKTTVEEESNIFHVGITRASESLYLVFFLEKVYTKKRAKEKRESDSDSPFIVDIKNSILRFLPKEYRFKDLFELRDVFYRI